MFTLYLYFDCVGWVRGRGLRRERERPVKVLPQQLPKDCLAAGLIWNNSEFVLQALQAYAATVTTVTMTSTTTAAVIITAAMPDNRDHIITSAACYLRHSVSSMISKHTWRLIRLCILSTNFYSCIVPGSDKSFWALESGFWLFYLLLLTNVYNILWK